MSGDPEYMIPNVNNWPDVVTASCTLPFVNKGKYNINDIEYFDGGWPDAIPAKWAYNNGARHITVLRTWPKEILATQSREDYFGSMSFRSTSGLQSAFGHSYEYCNNSI